MLCVALLPFQRPSPPRPQKAPRDVQKTTPRKKKFKTNNCNYTAPQSCRALHASAYTPLCVHSLAFCKGGERTPDTRYDMDSATYPNQEKRARKRSTESAVFCFACRAAWQNLVLFFPPTWKIRMKLSPKHIPPLLFETAGRVMIGASL